MLLSLLCLTCNFLGDCQPMLRTAVFLPFRRMASSGSKAAVGSSTSAVSSSGASGSAAEPSPGSASASESTNMSFIEKVKVHGANALFGGEDYGMTWERRLDEDMIVELMFGLSQFKS